VIPAPRFFSDQSKEVIMEEKPLAQPESDDRKEIYIILAVGIILIACICCLLTVAGVALYQDLGVSIPPKSSPTGEAISAPTPEVEDKVFSEEFKSNRNGWTEGFYEDEYGTIDYTINGTYRWDVTAVQGVNQKSWAADAPVVVDFIAAADALHVSGADNASYGLVFRLTDAENLYYFCISDVGYYYVGLLESGVWTTLIDWTETTLINVNAVNRLKVEGNGDRFTFYINDNPVNTVNDGTHPSGTAGLAIELYDPGDKSIFEFDNFTIELP
jgi:hypothetical protein